MKKSFYTIGSLIILLIAAFIFVLVPIFAGGRVSNNLPAFGKYDGTEIKYEQNSEFANYVARYAEYYKNQGIEISNSNEYYIFNYAFNTTVTQLAYQKAVKKSGYVVPTTAINRAVRPYFADETGNFSQKLYNIALKDRPDDIAALRDDFRSTLTTQRYAEDSFGGQSVLGNDVLYGLKKNSKEASFLKEMSEGQRTLNVASFNMADYPDSEKVAYGKANSEKFVKYDFSIITVADKGKAASLAKRIKGNEITFADAVSESQKSYSNDSGKINSKYHYQIEKFLANKEDMAKITGLNIDEVSDPVQTTVGYSIFKVDTAAKTPDFKDEATIRTVYNYLTANEFSHIEDYYTETAKAFATVAKNKGFNAACTQYNVKKASVPAFALNYGNASVLTKLDTSIDGLSGTDRNETFLKTAFGLKNGELSAPIVNNRNVIVMQVTGSDLKAADPIPAEALADELSNFDTSSAQQALLTSPKLVNNVQDVFFNHMMKN